MLQSGIERSLPPSFPLISYLPVLTTLRAGSCVIRADLGVCHDHIRNAVGSGDTDGGLGKNSMMVVEQPYSVLGGTNLSPTITLSYSSYRTIKVSEGYLIAASV